MKNLKQSQDAKRLSLAEWRASRLHELDLPSGLHVTVRDVDMTDLLLTGLLPAAVMEEAAEAAKITDSLDLEKLALKMMEENGPAFKAMLNAIVKAALIEPKIGDVVDDTHITLDELTIEDKSAIMQYVNREVEQIKSFREGEDQPVASVQPGNGILEKAK